MFKLNADCLEMLNCYTVARCFIPANELQILRSVLLLNFINFWGILYTLLLSSNPAVSWTQLLWKYYRMKVAILQSVTSLVSVYQGFCFIFESGYNLGHNVLRLLMFCQIFLSPQVKRMVIISNKHDIYELPHHLSNDLRLRILGN